MRASWYLTLVKVYPRGPGPLGEIRSNARQPWAMQVPPATLGVPSMGVFLLKLEIQMKICIFYEQINMSYTFVDKKFYDVKKITLCAVAEVLSV